MADATNGFRAIRTELFLKMPLREKGFVIIMEELMWARRYNCTVTNVATTLYSRSAEQRSTMFNYTLGQVCVYLKYAMMARFSRPALPANLALMSARSCAAPRPKRYWKTGPTKPPVSATFAAN